jgi:hypothetical protein
MGSGCREGLIIYRGIVPLRSHPGAKSHHGPLPGTCRGKTWAWPSLHLPPLGGYPSPEPTPGRSTPLAAKIVSDGNLRLPCAGECANRGVR